MTPIRETITLITTLEVYFAFVEPTMYSTDKVNCKVYGKAKHQEHYALGIWIDAFEILTAKTLSHHCR